MGNRQFLLSALWVGFQVSPNLSGIDQAAKSQNLKTICNTSVNLKNKIAICFTSKNEFVQEWQRNGSLGHASYDKP